MADSNIFYVADLHAYNAGRLRGAYVHADEFADGEDMATAIDDYICRNVVVPGINPGVFAGPVMAGTEEYLVHDYVDGPICGLASELGETSDWVRLWELCNLLDNADNADALVAYMSHESLGLADLDDVEERFGEAFMGLHESVTDYVYSFFEAWDPERAPKREPWGEGPGPLPSVLWNAIDWAGVWRSEFDQAGWWTLSAEDGGVYIFSQ